ncbi:hypothetical protein [Anaerocolumna xylanovorans]|nr:hypothetical protein [Anaerocolumna xylanovorans]
MKWKILFVIAFTAAIILSVLYYREINNKNTFIFYGENENWRATYTEIKMGNKYYDSFSLEYKNARDANGNLTAEVKKIGKIDCDIDGEVPLRGGSSKEDFTGSYAVHYITEEPKGERWYNLNKVYTLNLKIMADSGWDTLTLDRADVKIYSAE